MNLAAIYDVKATGEHIITSLPDLVDTASANQIDDFQKIVRMTMRGQVADIFFYQNSFGVDKMGIFLIDSHPNILLFFQTVIKNYSRLKKYCQRFLLGFHNKKPFFRNFIRKQKRRFVKVAIFLFDFFEKIPFWYKRISI